MTGTSQLESSPSAPSKVTLECRLDTRLSPAEYDAVCRISLREGISVSHLVRMAVLRFLAIPPSR